MYNVTTISNVHPSTINPYRGLFNHRSFRSLVKYEQVDLETISPRPIAPPRGPFSKFSTIPKQMYWDNYLTYYPTFLYPIPKSVFKYTIAQRSFRRTVGKFLHNNISEPDIIHAGHILFDGYGAIPYCKDREIPLTVMGRGYLLNNYTNFSNRTQKKIRSVLDFASGVICVSNDLAKTASLLTEDDKVHVVANGTEPDLYPMNNKDNIQKQLSIQDDTLVVLFCGSFTERKGIQDIMTMIENTSPQNIHFLFVGHHGQLKTELVKRLSNSEYKNNYTLYNGLPPFGLRQLYAIADVLLLPSYAEGRPNVIYEAMASQTAVIATNIPGIKEQIIDKSSGLLFEPGDWQSMHKLLEYVNNSRDILKNLKENGHKRLINNGWLWEEHANKISGIHREIINCH